MDVSLIYACVSFSKLNESVALYGLLKTAPQFNARRNSVVMQRSLS